MVDKSKCKTAKKSILEEALDASKKAVEDFGKVAEMIGDFVPGVAKDAASVAKCKTAGGARGALKMQRSLFKGTLSVFDSVHKQAGKVIEKNLSDNEKAPAEVRELVKEWSKVIKTGRDEMKGAVEKSFDLIDQYLSKVQKSAKAKPVKKAAPAGAKPAAKAPVAKKPVAKKKAAAKKPAAKKAPAKKAAPAKPAQAS